MGPMEVFAQNSAVNWSALDMGFAVSSSSNTAVKSSAGQLFVGASQDSITLLESGFLAITLLRGLLVSVEEDERFPTVYLLSQNYPNPFNPSTTIRYEIPHQSRVEIRIYNILGQHVATLVNKEGEPGRYAVVYYAWNDNGAQVGSGVFSTGCRRGTLREAQGILRYTQDKGLWRR